MICKRFLITGTVQGVYFRQSTRNVARQLGLTGWVRNLKNGAVEVCACGDEIKVNQLQFWLNSGPPNAVVEKVEKSFVEMDEPQDFGIII